MRMLYVIGVLFSVALLGCSRQPAANKNKSILAIKAPQSKVGSLAAMPAGRKACYGVSVSGPGITFNPALSCSPSTGIVAGFVESGQNIEVSDVPQGAGRKIDLYLFLQLTGEDNPCPQMGAYFSASQLPQVYHLGSVDNVTLDQEVQQVEITAVFPGETQNLAVQQTLPSSCLASTTPSAPIPGFNISAGSGVATGTGLKLFGRIGKPYAKGVATGGGFVLKAQ